MLRYFYLLYIIKHPLLLSVSDTNYSLLLTSIYVNMFETMTVVSLVYSFIMFMQCVALFFLCVLYYTTFSALSILDKNV